ncbi:fungal-specific transcription factor domain-containing protein [Hypoxylon argillaceum]|nr:fungal-specific transcription factor domain-containing protein [Hypoxylon argillaceum]
MASLEGSISPQGASSNSDQSPHGVVSTLSAPTKRTRVLLSCHPCRSSKLKCNRASPCGQCIKRGKPDACAYAPRLEKSKPAKTMAARLKRLEGMVRGMVELDGAASDSHGLGDLTQGRNTSGSVVHSEGATNYVGGTHFMAILEDLEDLKTYFEDPEVPELDMEDPYESLGPSEMLILSRGAPRNKEELLAMLPDKSVMDRLMNRYFNSNSPSQHIIHIPTFTRQYNEFLKNRHEADIHWIAALFMILALGIFFSSFQAPHELEVDSPTPAMSRFRQYRGACGWALIWGKYSQPGPYTLQAMVLYTEADFLVNRVSQMNCYLLCSTLIRLMLKMGLHRDPSNLPRITPYEGEMRRRMWNLAVQIDLLVAFHLGLPCMIHGIESDTALPRNLLDSDFDEDSTELPPSRPATEYTPVTYPINKARIARGFGLVARLSHSLTLPSYTEIMRVDARIQDVWSSVPTFMKVKPLSECVTDAPMLVIQRFGLAALYQKSRCVLHRRYLVGLRPLKEHDYSRRTCLEAAIALLGYQSTMFEATKPGAILAQNGWFIASLAINDFLLADMVVALAIQQQNENEDNLDWMATCTPTVTKEFLIDMLQHSYTIWMEMAITVVDCRKAATVVRTMLRRIQTQLGISLEGFDLPDESIQTDTVDSSGEQTSSMGDRTQGSGYTSSPSDGYNGCSGMEPPVPGFANLGMEGPSIVPMEDLNDTNNLQQMDMVDPWGIPQTQSGYDWVSFPLLSSLFKAVVNLRVYLFDLRPGCCCRVFRPR